MHRTHINYQAKPSAFESDPGQYTLTSGLHPFLLSVVMSIVLNACGTVGSRPVANVSVERGLTLPTETTAGDRLNDLQRDPSMRSLKEVLELSRSTSGYQLDVALEILRSLESVSSGQLTSMIDEQRYDPEFTGWLELALQARTILISGSSVTVASRKWANDGHVITPTDFAELVTHYGKLFSAPSRVAILLPTDGGLAVAAKAIRDGILSAYLEQPGESVIRFYSSGENSESALTAYQQALREGATQIVGPLRLESTRTIASMDNPRIPVLLLNEAAGNSQVGSNQGEQNRIAMVSSLSLSQVEEAVAIATNALAQGKKQAILIVPDSDWGTRIGTAFATVFEQGEGNITATTRFNKAQSDHSATLTKLLKIDESKQRKADLQSRLGIPLTFEPNRRDDFDFIFLAADPLEGRELKPLLRFHDTGDIPVYAMSRIYSGKVEPASDLDLNGVVFPATPWQLQVPDNATLELDSLRGGAFGNLYALGQDAWHLLPWLPLMQKDPDLWFPGDVGSLRLQANGQLYRQHAWAQFSAGRPVAYQWPDNH